ncbi:MAG: hypothetical protein HY376_02230 [Candidatus Blackburnbacteria bacterium]|nr:hypothetical protein [Candidatus Blackburnbacteria bacterium]
MRRKRKTGLVRMEEGMKRKLKLEAAKQGTTMARLLERLLKKIEWQ